MKNFLELSPSAERVVDVAERLIQQQGYTGFSYEDIAREIGIRKPSVHHHFATKADLVTTVARRYVHRFEAHLQDIERSGLSAAGQLLAYAELFAQTYRQDRRLCLCGMLGSDINSLPPETAVEVARFFRLCLDWLAQVLNAGQQKGELKLPQSSRLYAEIYLTALEGGLVVSRCLNRDKLPLETARLLVESWAAQPAFSKSTN